MKRALLIVNPYSTHVTGPAITAVENALREQIDVETSFTQFPGHATQLAAAAAADSVDAIVVFSGDGTYNEALNGADGALPIGFLPGGATSVLPRALGLSRDPAAAARAVGAALAEGRLRRITLGTVNGRRFSFSAGIGFDAEAVRRLDRLGRDPAGARPGDVDVRADGDADAARAARDVAARRSRSKASDARRSSSSATAIRTRSRARCRCASLPARGSRTASTSRRRGACAARDVPRLATAIMMGRRYGPEVMTGLDLDRIEIHCDYPLPMQADGEDLGDVEHAVFEAHRDAVAVLV